MTPQNPPESYVVRIYRRDPRWPSRLVGTVETVANGSEQGFRNLRELQRILVAHGGHTDARTTRSPT